MEAYMQDQENKQDQISMNMPALERHYTVSEICELWHLNEKTVRKIFEQEPGVVSFGSTESRYKRRYISLRIPESALVRFVSPRYDRPGPVLVRPSNQISRICYTDAKFSKDHNGLQDLLIANLPPHSGSLWLRSEVIRPKAFSWWQYRTLLVEQLSGEMEIQ
jgi:hypothetical protein